METVQVQCGHCHQLMAVSVQHLGVQVHCPHCQNIVQVPASNVLDAATRADEELPKLRVPTSDHESILSEGSNASDDLFGDHAAPRLELPRSQASAPATLEQPAPTEVTPPAELAPHDDDLPLPRITRPIEKPSLFVPILLMFLIPYAVATTGYIAWLLYSHSRNRIDPLERLPDPKPGEGGPRQIQHDLEVNLRTPLKQPLRVGDLEVTPVTVRQTAEGDLTLALHTRNVSRNFEFNPMLDDFGKYRESLQVGKPYTFLEPLNHKPEDRLYGGYLQWLVRSRGADKEVDQTHRIRPGEEMTILLTTRDKDRPRVAKLLDHAQDVLWRVQMRRGMLSTRAGPKSATAVIGVEFNTSAITKAEGSERRTEDS